LNANDKILVKEINKLFKGNVKLKEAFKTRINSYFRGNIDFTGKLVKSFKLVSEKNIMKSREKNVFEKN
jgi:hypothetical protein